jgi:hypothetical protein
VPAPPLQDFEGLENSPSTVGRKFSKWIPSMRNHCPGTDQATGLVMSTIKAARAELLRGGAVDRGTREIGVVVRIERATKCLNLSPTGAII